MNAASPRRRRFPGTVSRVLAAVLGALLLVVLAWVIYAFIGMRAVAKTSGTLHLAGLSGPVTIVRDARDVPHITAGNDRDLFFAQGYAEASDRLFQMDLLRRYVYGRLAEVLGPAVLPADENARIAPVRQIVAAQWRALDPRKRALLYAFAAGVNAAIRTQPLPAEFHLLLYKPQPWQPQDTLAVGMATVLDLIDPWDDVIRRDAVALSHGDPPERELYAITDPRYDAPIAGSRVARVARLTPRAGTAKAAIVLPKVPGRPPVGSNEWAVGAAHSTTGRAMLANDPHLRLGIPGVWYLVDLRAPDLHVAGASLAGTPGVILGHNRQIAWGATNGTVTTESVYRDSLSGARIRRETFHVRFGKDVTFAYYRTKHGFAAATSSGVAYAVDWNAARLPDTPLTAFLALDRAQTMAQALEALRSYPGPPQNFVLAGRNGAVAYHLAGLIPDDPQWGLRVHSGSDPRYAFVPFDRLPHVDAARNALLFTANNRTYGAGYAYRLSPNFAPPYRAYRIRTLLHGTARLSPADLARFQTDTLSIPDRDIARALVLAARRTGAFGDRNLRPYLQLLAEWNGRFDPGSRGAPIAREVRRIAVASLARYDAGAAARAYQRSAGGAELVLLMRVLRDRPKGWWPHSDYDGLLVNSLRTAVRTYGTKLLETWGEYGRVTVKHPLALMGFSFLNGATFPGDGDSYAIHVQTAGHSQSFRAVWDVGNWDAGGISIPSGESGEPASGHYTDQSKAWVREDLEPLPFSAAAVRTAARATLTLLPSQEKP